MVDFGKYLESVNHKEREHSKFSASGSERWLNCAASVALEEMSPPSKDSVWSVEGTQAHEVLEHLLKCELGGNDGPDVWEATEFFNELNKIIKPDSFKAMVKHANGFIKTFLEVSEGRHKDFKTPLYLPEYHAERRVYNSTINNEFALEGEDAMFGTIDARAVEIFGTLHVWDYKYGAGHIVSPRENTQAIQYGLASADEYLWNFQRVVVHIYQPRAGGDIHKYWEVSIDELFSKWLPMWRRGVERVEYRLNEPFKGSWCHWCRAKAIDPQTGQAVCPEQRVNKFNKLTDMFNQPF